MPYAHDLFISYPSPDRPWAIKLMNDLKAKRPSLKIFFDQTSLRTGDRWEPQLDAAIDNSRHLAVLWTDNASSGWVEPEFERFDAGRRRATTSERQLLFYIPLQGSRANLERFQGFAQLRSLQIYGRDPQSLAGVERDAWDKMIARIDADIAGADANVQPIPLVILAATTTQFQGIKRDGIPAALNFNSLTQQLGTDYNRLVARYGAASRDWQPFILNMSVIDHMEAVAARINACIAATGSRIAWNEIVLPDPNDPEFSRLMDQTTAVLTAQPSVVAVDPISLYQDEVFMSFRYLSRCFENENTLFLIFSPIATGTPSHLDCLVQHFGQPMLNNFFSPSIPVPDKYPKIALPIGNDDEITRLVFINIGRRIVGPATAAVSSFLGD